MKQIKTNVIHIIFFFIILLLSHNKSYGNPGILSKKITIQVHNETVPQILKKIETITQIRFFYASDILDLQKKYSFNYSNETLGFVLSTIISTNEVYLYILDNTIIFYKNNNPPPGNIGASYKLPQYNTEKANISSRKIIYDTIKQIIYDSITIKKIDTLFITKYDTVQINIKRQKVYDKKNGIYITTGMNVGRGSDFYNSKNSILDSLYNIPQFKSSQIQMYNVIADYNHNLFSLKSGVQFYAKQKKLDFLYSYSKIDSTQIIGYIRKGPPHIIPGSRGDSIPIYKTDTIELSYKNINTTKYLVFPIIVGYSFPITKKLSVLTDLGISYSLLLNSKGSVLDNSYMWIPLEEVTRNSYVSALSNVGISYNIYSKHFISVSGGFQSSITSINKQDSYLQLSENMYAIMVSYSYKIKEK